jgi:hypothetical protein
MNDNITITMTPKEAAAVRAVLGLIGIPYPSNLGVEDTMRQYTDEVWYKLESETNDNADFVAACMDSLLEPPKVGKLFEPVKVCECCGQEVPNDS